MTPLAPEFLNRPFAHRGYHDLDRGVPENSRAAFEAAIEAGYGIELDVQPSSDGTAMVFHDYQLDRLTGAHGNTNAQTTSALGAITLTGSSETVPTLVEVLELIAGRTPILVEIKDQDGQMGPNVGPLEQAVALELAKYPGPFALMSFNPHSVAAFAQHRNDVPLGIVTDGYSAEDWPELSAKTRAHLREIPDFNRVGASFISHQASDLARPRVAEIKAMGADILCWTIRSAEEEFQARKVADNITFEGYAAKA